MGAKYDFGGWATRNDLKCSDGRTIRRDAFKENDGQTVPLVWQHQHNDPMNVLGHALLENRAEGVYAYCSFNDTEAGQQAKAAVEHKDITALSIYANQLQQHGGDVIHGRIKEVSLVLAGANPGALIDFPTFAHSDGELEELDEEATIYTGEPIELTHADEEKPKEEEKEEMAKEDKTIKEVFDTLTEEQKTAVYAVIGMAIDDAKGGENEGDEAQHSDEGEEEMKYNVFDESTARTDNVLTHADEEQILAAAKKNGSFRNAFEDFAEANALQHAEGDPEPVSGFNAYTTGATSIEPMFPEWHDVRPGAPELITDELGWVDVVLRKVHKSPFSRIRTSYVDIRNIDDLRARGYKKGTKKALAGNYQAVRRTTDPQTVYVKSALNRDDVVDITDFDYVAYQYGIDKLQLNEEVATAIMLGDGRVDGADGKIEETHIRPIWTDDDLYTIHKELVVDPSVVNGTETQAHFGESYILAEAAIEALLDAKIDYRGTGTPDMFCTQQFINKMLLAKDLNGRRIYANKGELATALGVNNIYPVSKMAGKTRTVGEGGSAKTMELDAIVMNLADYAVGSTKGGEITHFNQFDIDFNQLKSLLETRLSGANTRIYSAIVLEHEHQA